jgi:hypothetical protein
MATTTNFGWTTPDNTGYVKDGALAIRTLGSAIDSTLYDLDRVGQVIQTTGSSSFDTTSTSYVDVTSMSAAITPTKSSSKILVSVSFDGKYSGPWQNPNIAGAGFQIVRNSTSIMESGPWTTWTLAGSNTISLRQRFCLMYLDSPATTSATTYKLQCKMDYNTTNAGVAGFPWSIILQEVIV